MTAVVTPPKPQTGWRLWLRSSLPFFVVLLVAIALRLWKLTDWSLWEDEETTIFFSQQPGKAFPSFFPVFFVALGQLYKLTGISVAAGRALSACMGVLDSALVFVCFKRLVGRNAAVLAALLLAVNLGHLFWSQSIRYFTTLLAFQILSMYWFLEGMEKRSFVSLLLANAAFALALFTHFSALLQLPVYVGYLMVTPWLERPKDKYDLKSYMVFGLPMLLIVAGFGWRFMQLQGVLAGMHLSSARNAIHVLATVVGYAGLPVLVLGMAAPFLSRDLPARLKVFFVLAGFLPVLELITIAKLDVVNVVWYYAFVFVVGLTISAALTLVALYQRRWRCTSLVLGLGTFAYYGVFLFQYYTSMHGDRPRWEEAAGYLCQHSDLKMPTTSQAKVFATVPGVVAFYLGVEAGETMGHPLVKGLPPHPTELQSTGNQWFVVEASVLSEEYTAWFQKQCELKAEFEARTGPKDRMVRVYYFSGLKDAH